MLQRGIVHLLHFEVVRLLTWIGTHSQPQTVKGCKVEYPPAVLILIDFWKTLGLWEFNH